MRSDVIIVTAFCVLVALAATIFGTEGAWVAVFLIWFSGWMTMR